jgi:hypothetical protein
MKLFSGRGYMDEKKSEKRLFGNLGLGMLILAIFGSHILGAITMESVIPAVFYGIALLLAIIFGSIGWIFKTGKIAVIGSICFIAIGIVATFFLYFMLLPKPE